MHQLSSMVLLRFHGVLSFLLVVFAENQDNVEQLLCAFQYHV